MALPYPTSCKRSPSWLANASGQRDTGSRWRTGWVVAEAMASVSAYSDAGLEAELCAVLGRPAPQAAGRTNHGRPEPDFLAKGIITGAAAQLRAALTAAELTAWQGAGRFDGSGCRLADFRLWPRPFMS